jgi:hypothetical protein
MSDDRRMSKKFGPFCGALLVFLIVFLLTENYAAPSFENCISQNSGDHGTEKSENKGRIVGRFIFAESICSLRLIDRHNGFFAAIAAFVIAAFTFTLWQSTEKLWRASEDQIEHAKNEAMSDAMRRLKEEARLQEQINIAGRSADAAKQAADALPVVERAYIYPIIIAHGAIEDCIKNALVFYLGDPTKDDVPATETAELTFKFKNFGKTPAILKSAFVGFGVHPIGAEIGLSIPEAVLGVLEETNPLTSQMQIGITRKQAQHILVHTGHVCFTGEITFDDIWGNEHTTKFYFVWDKEIKRMALRSVETKTKPKNG